MLLAEYVYGLIRKKKLGFGNVNSQLFAPHCPLKALILLQVD
jgi:hypothetical protein